jgi:Protein of unknown function (DUF3631)
VLVAVGERHPESVEAATRAVEAAATRLGVALNEHATVLARARAAVAKLRGIDRIWTDALLQALHKLEDSNWDEFWGLDGAQDPHRLTKAELYRLLRTKSIFAINIFDNALERRTSRRGFRAEQFQKLWAAEGYVLRRLKKIVDLRPNIAGTGVAHDWRRNGTGLARQEDDDDD